MFTKNSQSLPRGSWRLPSPPSIRVSGGVWFCGLLAGFMGAPWAESRIQATPSKQTLQTLPDSAVKGLFDDLFRQDGGFPIHDGRPRDAMPILENNPRYRYMPVDAVHYGIKLEVNHLTSEIKGQVEVSIVAKTGGVGSVSLDARDLKIDRVLDPSGQSLSFRHQDDLLKIQLAAPLAKGQQTSVTVVYQGVSPQSLQLTGPDASNPQRMPAAYTYTQPEETPTWLPCIDRPDDKATMDIQVTVAEGISVLSNGQLTHSSSENGKTKWSYRMDEPIAPYLVSLAVGAYQKVAIGQYLGKHLELWTPPALVQTSLREVEKTPEMMQIFSDFTGVPYPFSSYAQSVAETYRGSMEHQTATTMGGVVMAGDGSGEGVVAHELAHQWFGDWVTCRTWGELWLNEGFASYLPYVFFQKADQPLRALGQLDGWRRGYFSESKTKVRALSESDPVVEAIFDSHSYEKGALVIHLMRRLAQGWPSSNGALGLKSHLDQKNSLTEISEVSEGITEALKIYLNRHGRGNATNTDLQRALEEATGQSWQLFFDQWVRSPGHPQLAITYSNTVKNPTTGALELVVDIKQTQSLPPPRTPVATPGEQPVAKTPWRTFTFPLELELIDALGQRQVVTVDVFDNDQQFMIPVSQPIVAITADPQWVVPAEISVDQGVASWVQVLRSSPFSPSRLTAFRALTQSKVLDPSQPLGQTVFDLVVADKDPYVTIQALDTLLQSTAQPPPFGWIRQTLESLRKRNLKDYATVGALARGEEWLVTKSTTPPTTEDEAAWQKSFLAATTVGSRKAYLRMLHVSSVPRAQEFIKARLGEARWSTQDRSNMINELTLNPTPVSLEILGEVLASTSNSLFAGFILGAGISQKWDQPTLVKPTLKLLSQHTKVGVARQGLKFLAQQVSSSLEICQALAPWEVQPPVALVKLKQELGETRASLKCGS